MDTPQTQPSAEPGHDFWIIVALQPDHNEAWILQASEDARARDVITGSALSDDCVSLSWVEGRGWGLFKLWLKPWTTGPHVDGDYDYGVDVPQVEVIHEVRP